MVQRQMYIYVVVGGSIHLYERDTTGEIGKSEGRHKTQGVTLKMDESHRGKFKSVSPFMPKVDQSQRHIKQSNQETTWPSARSWSRVEAD